jgi:polysaccharide export outer membrane protein
MIRLMLLRLLAMVSLMCALMFGATGALAQTAVDSGYILGPDDSVQVIVYGQPEFGVQTRIKSDGTIVMPLIGTIKAAGMTNITLAKAVTDRLTSNGFLKDPIVNVEIGGYVSKTVNVAGKVTTPGIYPLDRPYHALDMLLKAGWIRENGANYVYLRRPGQPEARLDVEGLVRGDDSKDPLLKAGDTLYVPDADVYYISGQVNRPGSFAMQPNLTIRQALVLAGGVTQTGSANKVGLIRGNAKEVDADPSQVIQKSDIIVVKERLF